MAIIVPQEAERAWLEHMVGLTPLTFPLKLELYTAVAGGLTETTTFANLTLATNGTCPGYAGKTLAAASWNAATSGNPASIQFNADQVFTFTGAGIALLGWVILNNAGNKILAIEPGPSSYTPAISGDTLTVRPAVTLG